VPLETSAPKIPRATRSKQYHAGVSYQSKSNAFHDGDGFRLETHATLTGNALSDDDDQDIPLGFGHCSYLQVVRAGDSAAPMTHLWDATQELLVLAHALMDDDMIELKDSVAVRFDHEFSGAVDILLIHEVFVMPQARGQDLGLLLAASMIADFAPSNGLIVLEPAPLSDEMSLKGRSLAAAEKALGHHWAKLGFVRIGRTNYWGFNTNWKSPRTEWPSTYSLDLQGKVAVLPKMMREHREMHGIPLT
jgi:GNAT superfamily N-acetyltransferase